MAAAAAAGLTELRKGGAAPEGAPPAQAHLQARPRETSRTWVPCQELPSWPWPRRLAPVPPTPWRGSKAALAGRMTEEGGPGHEGEGSANCKGLQRSKPVSERGPEAKGQPVQSPSRSQCHPTESGPGQVGCPCCGLATMRDAAGERLSLRGGGHLGRPAAGIGTAPALSACDWASRAKRRGPPSPGGGSRTSQTSCGPGWLSLHSTPTAGSRGARPAAQPARGLPSWWHPRGPSGTAGPLGKAQLSSSTQRFQMGRCRRTATRPPALMRRGRGWGGGWEGAELTWASEAPHDPQSAIQHARPRRPWKPAALHHHGS